MREAVTEIFFGKVRSWEKKKKKGKSRQGDPHTVSGTRKMAH
jgi:hypothetical protein